MTSRVKMEDDGIASEDELKEHVKCEEEKKHVRDQLIPRMTALYAQVCSLSLSLSLSRSLSLYINIHIYIRIYV